MLKLTRNMILLCFAYIGLTGCGTKGPLYIPEQRYPQQALEPTLKAPLALPNQSIAMQKTVILSSSIAN